MDSNLEVLIAEAKDAVGRDDYGRAIECHEQAIERLRGRNEEEAQTFTDGPHLELLLATLNHAAALVDRCHFTTAYPLLQRLEPYFAETERRLHVDALMGSCQHGLLYTRTSQRSYDVLLWSAEGDHEPIRQPLVEALKKLGVLVAPNQFGSALTNCLPDSDMVVVVLSRAFFGGDWPASEIHRLLEPTGSDYGRVLPVWHGISRAEVLAASEPLENKLAFDDARLSVLEIAQGIADIVRPDLASDVLRKAAWNALLTRVTLGEALAQPRFELSLRHDPLSEDLIARIRLVRAALLCCFRYEMKVWIEGFRRELEPYRAIREWEILARVFQETLALIRHVKQGSEEELAAEVAGLVSDFAAMSEAERRLLIEGYAEFSGLPADRLFLLIWAASQLCVSVNRDLGFSPPLLAIAEQHLHRNVPLVDSTEADFESVVGAMEIDVKMADDTDAQLVDDLSPPQGGLQLTKERPSSRPWDVFISHASEDKEQVVSQLAELLKAHGAKVWYDSFTLREGLSLSASIDAGIDGAEFGVIVLSPSFVKKDWPRYELERLRRRVAEQADRMLIVWHQLASKDAPEYSTGTDPAAYFHTSELSIPELEKLLLQQIRPELAQVIQRRLNYVAAKERVSSGATTRQTVTPAPRRHERLNDDLVERVRLLRAVLFEGYPRSMEFWIDGFLRDTNPEGEIAHWERMAAMFQEAALVVDVLQQQPRSWLRRVFQRRRTLNHREVFFILNRLAELPNEPSTLTLLDQYPKNIVDTIRAIVASPSVIEMLGD